MPVEALNEEKGKGVVKNILMGNGVIILGCQIYEKEIYCEFVAFCEVAKPSVEVYDPDTIKVIYTVKVPKFKDPEETHIYTEEVLPILEAKTRY